MENPQTEDTSVDIDAVKGGRIEVNSELFKWIAIGVLVIVVLWLLYVLINSVKHNDEDYYQRQTHLHFNNTRGEDFDDEAKAVIENGEAIPNPRAIDHYRIGTVYLLNANDHKGAHRHFTEALNQIIDGMVNTAEAPFILNRIEDFQQYFIDQMELEDLPIQRALYVNAQNNREQIGAVKKKITEISKDDPEFKQKVLLSQQRWQSDNQNVHDSAIFSELKNQYQKVKNENSQIKNIQLHDYNEAVNWLRTRYKNDQEKSIQLEKVLSNIGNGYQIGLFPGVNEKDIITAVWQRSFDPMNKDNATQIREAMGDAILDCVERGSVVCQTGRTTKMWQALARVDKDEEMGVLKTKQAVRNEIYQKAAKIVDDFVGENGSASQMLKDAYNKGEDTEQVKELMECMHKKMDEMRKEYTTLIPPQQLDDIIEECRAVI